MALAAGELSKARGVEFLDLPIQAPRDRGWSDAQIQACRDFDSERPAQGEGDHPVCGEFGVRQGEGRPRSLHDVLHWSCDLLRLYQPERVAKEDALADLALACNQRYARIRLTQRLMGDRVGEKATLARDVRAKACAPLIFGQRRTLPFDVAPGVTPWSNFAADRARIESASLSASEQRRALELWSAGRLHAEGLRSPIKVEGAVRAFLTVIEEESRRLGTPVVLGEPTRWSLDFQRCLGPQFFSFIAFPKTLGALAIGMGFDLTPTRQEDALYRWLLERPDHSVEPVDIFRASLRLNQGDVYLSILTIENLLSRAWLRPERDSLAQTYKLRPIAHSIGPGADTYGTWYHFFGTMLYGYVRNEVSASGVAEIEALGSRFLSNEDESQENHLNRAGARVGAGLKRALRRLDRRDASWADPQWLQFEASVDHSEDLGPAIRRALR